MTYLSIGLSVVLLLVGSLYISKVKDYEQLEIENKANIAVIQEQKDHMQKLETVSLAREESLNKNNIELKNAQAQLRKAKSNNKDSAAILDTRVPTEFLDGVQHKNTSSSKTGSVK